jgi:tetratricopeptide (TPR) repeat protein
MPRLVRRRRVWAAVGLLALVLAGAAAVLAWPAGNPDQLWNQARADFEARRFPDAERKLGRLARLRTPTALDWMLRAQVAMGLDRNDEALADLAHVPDDHPMAPQARLQAGQLELRRHRAKAAEEAFLHALELDPKLVQARRELVYIYGMQLRRKELSAQFAALSALVPLTFEHVFTWCLTRGVVWEPTEVSADLARFLKADPSDRWSRLALAESLRQLGRLDEAEATLAALPAADPDALEGRVRLALDRGDPRAADELLAGAPPELAGHAGLARMRGRLAFGRHDGPEAIRQLRIAYAADPDNRDTLFFLGHALRMVGDEAAAKPFLDAARDQDNLNTLIQHAASPRLRENPKLPFQLGAACEAVHRVPEAKAWYKLAIARDPLDPEAQRALYRLEAQASAAPKAQ